MKVIYVLLLLINLLRCSAGPSAAISRRNVTLDLTLSAANSPSKVVPNTPNNEDVPAGFKKFVIFGDTHGHYFNVTDVLYNNVNLRINGADISRNYVYDVFSYWNDDQILAFCFRYDYERSHSKYEYYNVIQGVWKEVKESDFEANSNGKISGAGLKKLLKFTESQNPKITPDGDKKEGQKNKKLLIIIASAVGGIFVLLLLGFLAYYVFKK
ncbi:putative integral membrane protein [Theileria parva strain Muguga]|uniref:Uncharacterized protein n=1 Tax=Theileria parva TaxID=5875 RepID=Q4N4T7_THEPA|nr:putative integral membrane protein [Theileria parva strain Muguga]EAN32836.1 putative integral membrane protein [Theileria parva strain Muguga]|eukprot:XP_765119.1 hypothetical protein [Theileria parva strain Muguga]